MPLSSPNQYNIISLDNLYKNSPAKIIIYFELSLLDAVFPFQYDTNKVIKYQQF